MSERSVGVGPRVGVERGVRRVMRQTNGIGANVDDAILTGGKRTHESNELNQGQWEGMQSVRKSRVSCERKFPFGNCSQGRALNTLLVVGERKQR